MSDSISKAVCERDLLKAALDSSSDGILVRQIPGDLIISNREFLDMWHIPPELEKVSYSAILEYIASQVKEPHQFFSRMQQTDVSCVADSLDIIELKDGRRFEHRVLPQRSDGVSLSVVFNWCDITARQQMDAALTAERTLLRSLIDKLPVYLYVKDRAGRFILGNLPHTLHLGATSETEVTGKTDFDFYPEELAQRFQADDLAVMNDGLAVLAREEPSGTGGLHRWHSTTKVPLRDTAGMIIGLVGISLDITDRKQAEAESENLHRQLLEVSHQAGMSQVASDILHSIGNVLNSVNVSATLVAEQVRRSKASLVPKISALLQQHATDLGTFLTSDPKGKVLPGFLASLGDQLLAEQRSMMEELVHLRTNIEHIKEIVARQQGVVKVAGVAQTVPLTEVLDGVLRTITEMPARHQVEFVRDYQFQPTITIDRHKLTLILVNLVRNAKTSCDAANEPVGMRVTLRTTCHEQRVHILVIDNGIGIPPENLTRIFAHGGTTREGGRGFGLHSSALAARELGGSIVAQSDGLGHGAIFTVDLPTV